MKLLCVGNETCDTDRLVSYLAKSTKVINNGLLNLNNYSTNGYYHTSVVDLQPGEIAHIVSEFDCIKLLDQPQSTYPNFKSFITTIRLFYDLEKQGFNVEYRNNQNAQRFLYWKDFLTNKNKSFCFHPFVAVITGDGGSSTTICPKTAIPIKNMKDIIDWESDKEYSIYRDAMLAGKPIPTTCSDCYDREAEGQESARQFETLEWALRLGLDAANEFTNITRPRFYELRPNNTCNVMCRTCDNARSHLIDKEWKKIKIPLVPTSIEFGNDFNSVDFTDVDRIYVAGGEPTVMPEFYTFLRKCIDIKKTDFELQIGTNGMKYSDTLLKLLKNFPHVNFATSFDGYKKVNNYIRWLTDWDTIVANSHKILNLGHKLSLQTVISMYNVTRLHELFEFFDDEFPKSSLLVQVGTGQGDIFLPMNHPRPDLIVQSLKKCQKTKVYYSNGRSLKSQIDLLLDYYSSPSYTVNVELLNKFYQFNDKLDSARNSKLENYIPELAEARHICNL